jgi:threonine dehydrogenase-like Zn-dependent dehydrogenase
VIGAIGLLHLLTAKNVGVGKVIVVDLVEERLDYARKLGASETINAAKEDVEEGVRQLTEAMLRHSYRSHRKLGASPETRAERRKSPRTRRVPAGNRNKS